MTRRDPAQTPAGAGVPAAADPTAELPGGPRRPGRRTLALAGAALAATAATVRAETPAPEHRVAPRAPSGPAPRGGRWLLHRDDR